MGGAQRHPSMSEPTLGIAALTRATIPRHYGAPFPLCAAPQIGRGRAEIWASTVRASSGEAARASCAAPASMRPSKSPRSGGAPGRRFFAYFLWPHKESRQHAGLPPAPNCAHRQAIQKSHQPQSPLPPFFTRKGYAGGYPAATPPPFRGTGLGRMGGAQRYPSVSEPMLGIAALHPTYDTTERPSPCAPPRRSGAGERRFGRALFELRAARPRGRVAQPPRACARARARAAAAHRGVLSLVTFFARAKKVTWCRATPGAQLRASPSHSTNPPSYPALALTLSSCPRHRWANARPMYTGRKRLSTGTNCTRPAMTPRMK